METRGMILSCISRYLGLGSNAFGIMSSLFQADWGMCTLVMIKQWVFSEQEILLSAEANVSDVYASSIAFVEVASVKSIRMASARLDSSVKQKEVLDACRSSYLTFIIQC